MRSFWCAPLVLLACKSETLVQSSSCEGCHRPPDLAVGLEQQHPSFAVACVNCHGGDPAATTAALAHVSPPGPEDPPWRDRPLAARLGLPEAFLRFINPTDPDAAQQTCGNGAGVSCHPGHVEASARSAHATAAGILAVPLISVGTEARFGIRSAEDPDFDNSSAFTDRLSRYQPPAEPALNAPPEAFWAYAHGKSCTGCHLSLPGSTLPGRSQNLHNNGCAACHLVYGEDGLSQSDDPTVNKTERGHPQRHVITNQIPDRQCESCHHGSLRIGTAFRGLREPTAQDIARGLNNATLFEAPLHGQPANWYIDDDDGRDDLDTVPEDLHRTRGLGCVDCHVGSDLHGSGRLAKTAGPDTGIECEDCHGTFTAKVTPREDGRFYSSGGSALKRLAYKGEQVVLTSALTGVEHLVPQLLELRENVTLSYAHSEARHGRLECYACHSAWMQNFYATERVVDLRELSLGPLGDATPTRGAVRDNHLISAQGVLHLAVNQDGKFAPLMFNTAFLTVIVPCDPRVEANCEADPGTNNFGRKLYDRWLPQLAEGPALQVTPLVPHTTPTRAAVRACETCHPREIEADPDRPRVVYGFGSAEQLLTITSSTSTRTYVLDRFADPDGNALVRFPRPNTGPMPLFNAQKALNYRVPNPLR